MDNLTFTLFGLAIFTLIFGLVVERLTREDRKPKDKSK